MMYAIQVKCLSKRIGENTILNEISMQVKDGEIYGFLGANGAGKTSLMKSVFQMMIPDCGEVLLWNNPITREVSGQIDFVTYRFESLTTQMLIIASTILLGLVPLAVGMINKSTIATVVSSVVIVAFSSNSQGSTAGLLSIPVIALILGAVGLVVTSIAVKKILTSDLQI